MPALKVLIHVCYSEGTWSDLTLREIGVMFCGLDYAAVSQRVRRIQRRAETDKKLRRVFTILNVEIRPQFPHTACHLIAQVIPNAFGLR